MLECSPVHSCLVCFLIGRCVETVIRQIFQHLFRVSCAYVTSEYIVSITRLSPLLMLTPLCPSLSSDTGCYYCHCLGEPSRHLSLWQVGHFSDRDLCSQPPSSLRHRRTEITLTISPVMSSKHPSDSAATCSHMWSD